jgi:ubiquinone/menaquinone biosynthesis C-methylase UbiE
MNSRVWDFWATRYDSLWVQRFSLDPTRRAVINMLPRVPDCRLLDVGCGTGQLFGDLAVQPEFAGLQYTGIDASPRMIEVANRKHPEGTFILSSTQDYSEPDGRVDVITCTHAFPYFPDKPDVLHKFEKLLRPGGCLLLAQACTNNIYDAVIMAAVKLTTSRAQYLSARRVCSAAAEFFADPPEVINVNRNPLIPSIQLFKWIKRSEVHHEDSAGTSAAAR